MPAVEHEPKAEVRRIADSLRQLSPNGQSADATLIFLDQTHNKPYGNREAFPCFSVGCVALDVKINAKADGLVIPCLMPPLEFRTYRDTGGNHRSSIAVPDAPPEIIIARDDLPKWRGWEIGSRAVENFVWQQFHSAEFDGTKQQPLQAEFLPNAEALIMDAQQQYALA